MTESQETPTGGGTPELIAVFTEVCVRLGFVQGQAVSDIFETCNAISKKVDWRTFSQLADLKPGQISQVQRQIMKEFSVCKKCDGLRRRSAPGARMKTPCPVCKPPA